jgi:hypothetical protein
MDNFFEKVTEFDRMLVLIHEYIAMNGFASQVPTSSSMRTQQQRFRPQQAPTPLPPAAMAQSSLPTPSQILRARCTVHDQYNNSTYQRVW